MAAGVNFSSLYVYAIPAFSALMLLIYNGLAGDREHKKIK
jgi:hypothetical protein